MRRWRLGVDLGTNSLGWAVLWLNSKGEPEELGSAGSRIFSDGRDPKSGASLAVDRREARAMRRRRDRFQQRQRALMKYLVADGLFPADPAARKALEVLDPYALRARALDEALTLPELGRAIWHLNQRRGFKSNRKTDKPDDDSGKIKTGVGRLKRRIAEDENAAGAEPDSWTFGKWLHMLRRPTPEHPDGESVRTRLRPEQGDDAKGTGYDFYPGRELLEEEFRAIWAAQASHHAGVLTDEIGARLYEIVFHQRPLKQPQIGTCTFGNGEPRLAKAHPAVPAPTAAGGGERAQDRARRSGGRAADPRTARPAVAQAQEQRQGRLRFVTQGAEAGTGGAVQQGKREPHRPER